MCQLRLYLLTIFLQKSIYHPFNGNEDAILLCSLVSYEHWSNLMLLLP